MIFKTNLCLRFHDHQKDNNTAIHHLTNFFSVNTLQSTQMLVKELESE